MLASLPKRFEEQTPEGGRRGRQRAHKESEGEKMSEDEPQSERGSKAKQRLRVKTNGAVLMEEMCYCQQRISYV